MTGSKIMKWVTGAFEAILGIPVFGGLIIMGTYYTPLLIMFILHIITLVLSAKNNETKYGSILGIVTSVVAWIPIVGMIMHIITAVMLMVSAAKKETSQPSTVSA
ncbi:hypothetical protein [Cohnella boryungensis]|uniref:DUF4064 domain-containing protein n=1 Tax=Cohnella boryungensis TaxID=768479 RepID=A0ABV8SGS7_9BACL